MRVRAIFGLATLLATAPLAFASAQAATASVQQHSQHRPSAQAQRRPSAQAQHRWRKGERFDQKRATRYGAVDYRRYRGLKAPGRGQRWVRSGNDAVLISSNGVIAQVIANLIR